MKEWWIIALRIQNEMQVESCLCDFLWIRKISYLSRYGFVIAVTTIDNIGVGEIQPGRGFVVYPVKYKVKLCPLISLYPFICITFVHSLEPFGSIHCDSSRFVASMILPASRRFPIANFIFCPIVTKPHNFGFSTTAPIVKHKYWQVFEIRKSFLPILIVLMKYNICPFKRFSCWYFLAYFMKDIICS